MASPLDLAAEVLAGVRGEAQVTVVRERSLTSRFSRSAPTQATDVDAHAVHVLCVVDGHTGGATAATLERDALAGAGGGARVADAYPTVTCRDDAGRSGVAATTSTASGALDAAALAHAAAAKVVAGEAAALEPGEYPVVLDHDAVGTILDMLAGVAFNGL